MSDRADRGSDVSDRLSRRFEADEQSDESEGAESSGSSQSSKPSKDSKLSEDSKGEQKSQSSEGDEDEVNVKQDWTGRYMYLPDEIDSTFDSEYNRLVYECGQELDWKPKKNKHYYPIAVKHGIDAIEEMDANGFADAVEDMDLR